MISGTLSRLCCLLAVAMIMAVPPPLEPQAQELPGAPPDQSLFQSQLEFLDFTQPTTIRGRLRFIDVGEQEVWLDWDQRLEKDATGKQSWRTLEGQFMLLIHPQDTAQFERIKVFKPGTELQFVVQSVAGGRRVILSFTEPAPPESPL